MRQINKNCKGQSLFEVVLALFIITLIIVAVVILSTNSISNSIFSRNKTLASKYTQEAIEWLRSQKDLDFDGFKVKAGTSTYCLNNLSFNNSGVCGSGEEITDTIFKREVVFVVGALGGNVVITSNVVTYWSDSKGIHEARSVTDFNDLRDQ